MKFKKFWLQLKSKFRYFKKFKLKKVDISDNYKLVFNEHFTDKIETNWRLSYNWGWFHPDTLFQYCDREHDCVDIVNEQLVLKTKYDPIHIIKSELPDWQQIPKLPDEFTIPYKIGLIESIESWKYGWFTADIKLPKGKNLWPAFWLTGDNSWPPEIDILEAYCGKKIPYIKKWLFKDRKNWIIQPNVHYGIANTDSKKMYGPFDSPVKNATENFIEYALNWEKDFIRIYYNGYMILEITDKSILKWFNWDNCKQKIILNNGINYVNEGADYSKMIIDNVKVYQKMK